MWNFLKQHEDLAENGKTMTFMTFDMLAVSHKKHMILSLSFLACIYRNEYELPFLK